MPKWKLVVGHNMELLSRIIGWNISEGIRLFRISSDLVPFADHPEYGLPWRRYRRSRTGWWGRVLSPAREMIASALAAGGRFSMHPGQYVSISSASGRVRRASAANLEYHGALMDDLGLPRDRRSPINIHVGNGSKGESVVPLARKTLSGLSPSVLSRLVFENEQSGCWTPSTLIRCFPEIPVTLDYHHLLLNPDPLLSMSSVENSVAMSWGAVTPICHWSEGRSHPKDPAHSEYVSKLPPTRFDIEVEAKGKDLAVLRVLGAVARIPTAG